MFRYFNRSFNESVLENTLRSIIIAHNNERYAELMDTRKWLGLCLTNTQETLDNYDKGYDITGARITVGGQTYVNSVKHFNNKKKRIENAIKICEKYLPFKEV